MKQFTLLNSILAVTSLESQDGKGAYLNEAQLQAFEDAISGKDNRITELTQHETNYNNAVDKLNARIRMLLQQKTCRKSKCFIPETGRKTGCSGFRTV